MTLAAEPGQPSRLRASSWPWGWVTALVLVLAACQGSDPAPELRVYTGQTMGTVYTVKAVSVPGSAASTALQADIDALLEGVNQAMSTYREDSELSRFNAWNGTDWFPVSGQTATVVGEALRLADLTGGALDVTIGPLVDLWGFGPSTPSGALPSEGELALAASRVGIDHLQVRTEPPALRKTQPGLSVDLSAIAKGYAVDRVAERLELDGIDRYLVEVGGELRVKGLNAEGLAWRIAVETPTPVGRSVQRVVQPGDQGVATSGDYRNFREVNGKRYSHTIDPATGRPVEHTLASVTVLHPSAMVADGLATGLMVMGPGRGMAFAEAEHLPVLMLVRTGDGFQERASSAFETLLR